MCVLQQLLVHALTDSALLLSRLLALPLLMLLPTSLDTEEAPQQEELPVEPKADISMGPVV